MAKTARFSCANLETFIDKIPGSWTGVKGTLGKISSICDDGKIVSRKKVPLTNRECKNTIPVLENWWDWYKADRGTVPINFMDAIKKKTVCD